MSAKSIIAFGNLQKIESNHESNVRLVWYSFLAYELMNTDRKTYIQFDVITNKPEEQSNTPPNRNKNHKTKE